MKNIPIIDLHQDLMLHINHRDIWDGKWQTNFSMLDNSQTKIVIATAFPKPVNGDHLDPVTNNLIEKDFELYIEYVKNNDSWVIIKDSSDFKNVLGSPDKKGLILHVEGLNSFKDTKEDWDRLEKWYGMGWRSLGLVWNISNSLGGGTEDTDTGLTLLGKKVITWLKEHKMIIDLAHMNESTFWDTVSVLKNRPILISHGNTKKLFNNPRNYSDKQLKKIKESGGVIGVFFARSFLTDDDDVNTNHVLKHLNHMKNIVGIDHMALGTDFGGIFKTPKGLESVEKLGSFLELLLASGYSQEDVEKIAYKNAERVLMEYFTIDKISQPQYK